MNEVNRGRVVFKTEKDYQDVPDNVIESQKKIELNIEIDFSLVPEPLKDRKLKIGIRPECWVDVIKLRCLNKDKPDTEITIEKENSNFIKESKSMRVSMIEDFGIPETKLSSEHLEEVNKKTKATINNEREKLRLENSNRRKKGIRIKTKKIKIRTDGHYMYKILSVSALSRENLPKEYIETYPHLYRRTNWDGERATLFLFDENGRSPICLTEGDAYNKYELEALIVLISECGERLTEIKERKPTLTAFNQGWYFEALFPLDRDYSLLERQASDILAEETFDEILEYSYSKLNDIEEIII